MARDRFSTKPRPNAKGLYKRAYIVGRNLKVLQALSDHNALTFHDLLSLIGGDSRSFRENLNNLKNEPNEYIRIVPEIARARNLRQSLAYQLAPKGVTWLRDNGHKANQPKRVYNIAHATLATHIIASIASGGARIITWDEIQAHPKFPPHKDGTDLTLIPHGSRHIRPDCNPFRIQLEKDGVPHWRTLVIEADNATETIHPSDPAKYQGNSLYAKFEAYLDFMKRGEFKTRYGVSNFYVLFVFTSRARMAHAKETLQKLSPQGSPFFLFQQAYQDESVPHDYIFTSACERVGEKPLFLNRV